MQAATGRTFVRFVAWTGLFLFLSSELPGCSSSQLVDVWKDPEFHAALNSVFVIAVKKDPTRRRIWEDGFAEALQKRGVKATPSYRLFPNALPDTTAVVEAVRREGFDGVIVTVSLPMETEHTYVPGYVTTVPVTRYDRWWNVYRTYYREVYQPGYYETQTVARARTDIWATGGHGTLVWSGTSDVYDPTSSEDISNEITEMIVPELARQGIIPKKK